MDQVEDVISVEDSLSSDMEAYSSKSHDRNDDEMPVKVDPAVERVAVDLPEEVTGGSSNCNFLVLEVCFTFQILCPFVGGMLYFNGLMLITE